MDFALWGNFYKKDVRYKKKLLVTNNVKKLNRTRNDSLPASNFPKNIKGADLISVN